jgi:hypothetical protein
LQSQPKRKIIFKPNNYRDGENRHKRQAETVSGQFKTTTPIKMKRKIAIRND